MADSFRKSVTQKKLLSVVHLKPIAPHFVKRRKYLAVLNLVMNLQKQNSSDLKPNAIAQKLSSILHKKNSFI